jgi:hypothetical protein
MAWKTMKLPFARPKGRALGRLAALCLLTLAGAASGDGRSVGRVVIDTSAKGALTAFRPESALGAALDGSEAGETARLYTPWNVARMRSAGLRPITYRLRTELGIEAWHWGDEGTWSDPAHQQGYWVSSDHPSHPLMTSYGYKLPRRGDTIDNANNLDYSRLTDGDPATFWKTNPYLDRRYTGEPQARPQWLILEFDAKTPIDAAEIAWADPYAVKYEVQYWVGDDEYDPQGRWITFLGGAVAGGAGGLSRLTLSPKPIATQFVRVLLEQSSETAPPGANDVRDHLGFAVREAGFGRRGSDGVFHDAVRHLPSHKDQTVAHVSSTDPWHRAEDRDPNLEQPGLDRVFRSGLTNGLPMMVPVGVLYDIPENAAAEIRFLKQRGYPVSQVELGEEPDGQYVDAAHYGALYLEAARAIRAIDPQLKLGGPSLQSGVADTWLNPDPDRSWTSHFIRYLAARGALAELQFFSFERYPFDDICGDIHAKLIRQSRMMSALFDRLRADGVPSSIPWIITEYGFSAFSGRAMVEMPSALLMADMLGQFLSSGGSAAYLFGYGPNIPINQHLACAGFGNMMLHTADADGQAVAETPTYWAARLVTQTWAQPGDGLHRFYATRVNADGRGEVNAVKAYTLLRPDGRLATLLVNRDPKRTFKLRLAARTPGQPHAGAFAQPADLYQYSSEQYRWTGVGQHGRPDRDLPPRRAALARLDAILSIPPDSLTVVVSGGGLEPPR